MHRKFRLAADMPDTKVLMVIDDSEASKRAVRYLAGLVGRRRHFHIILAHVLPPLPPELLEHGGSEDPGREAELEREMKTEQGQWIAAAEKSAQKDLDRASGILKNGGVGRRSVRMLFCAPGEGRQAVDAVLNIARRYRCRTIIVGRRSVSRFHELFSQELPEGLLRRGQGFCIWVIE